jgi:Uma2 family endonuclease
MNSALSCYIVAGMKTEEEIPLIIPGVTEEEFYAWPDDGFDWQYLGGEMVMEPSPSDRHEDLFSFLHTLLRIYVDERGGGVVRGSRSAMRLDEKWSPQPDLMVVREERRQALGEQRLEGAADLVIEILSRGHPEIDLRRKLPRYREERIPEIWMIDPLERSVQVETWGDAGHTSRTLAAGRLDSTVVRGFWIEVAWLWQEPLPSSAACLRQILG